MHDPIDIAFGIAVLVAALMASGHAVIYKRDSRSAAIWAVLIWVMPALGAMLYLLMGINRVQRRATRMRRAMVRHRPSDTIRASGARCVPVGSPATTLGSVRWRTM